MLKKWLKRGGMVLRPAFRLEYAHLSWASHAMIVRRRAAIFCKGAGTVLRVTCFAESRWHIHGQDRQANRGGLLSVDDT